MKKRSTIDEKNKRLEQIQTLLGVLEPDKKERFKSDNYTEHLTYMLSQWRARYTDECADKILSLYQALLERLGRDQATATQQAKSLTEKMQQQASSMTYQINQFI